MSASPPNVPLAAVRRRLTSVFDKFLDSLQEVQPSLGWSRAMNGCMLPVEPARDVKLTVKSGCMPADLGGAYMRVGPNPAIWPPKKRMHVFDGDGMIHSIRFANGSAVYHCDFLQTPRYKFEQSWGEEWFPRIGEFHGKAGLAKIMLLNKNKNKLAGVLDHQASNANTAIGLTPDGKLWALNEAGAPFRFALDQAGAPKSIGFDSMDGTLEMNVSAHPKFDQRTGETFFHGRVLMGSFYAGRMADGKLIDKAELKMASGFHHDMFITENYVVIVDGSMRFTPKGVVQGKPLWNFDPKVKLRFGVFPRSCGKMTPEAFVWIEAPVAAEIVHTLHGYDEGGKIVLWSPVGFHDKKVESGILGGLGDIHMRRLVIDVEQKTVDVQQVEGGDKHCTEFPRIRDDRVGKRVRYGFSGLQIIDGSEFNFRGILKWDFEQARLAGEILFPEGVVGGEPVILPRGDGDDEGYIGLFLWNHATSESTFAVYDAQSFEATPVVELQVPRRVPLGFHAAWITEGQFQRQLSKL